MPQCRGRVCSLPVGTSLRTRFGSPADIVSDPDQATAKTGLTRPTLSAELEMTVALLVQIDKLVMLIESPVFTCERSVLIPMTIELTVYGICSSSVATARAGKVSLPFQVSLRSAHASTTK